MTSPWNKTRKKPYTELGIQRLKCIRCGYQARTQWNICADGNNYRPLCYNCDIQLNRMVLKWARVPYEIGEKKMHAYKVKIGAQ